MRGIKQRTGRKGGAMTLAWMVLANLFEPSKVAATKRIDTQRRIGSERERTAAMVSASAAPG